MRRYQHLEAGENDRNLLRIFRQNTEEYQICSTIPINKNVIIFAILITLGFFIYIPFLPFASNRRKSYLKITWNCWKHECFVFSAIAFVWPSNQTRDANLLLRPQEVTTRIWPNSICHKNASNQDLFLLVIVFSAIKNFDERQAIRDSWASDR